MAFVKPCRVYIRRTSSEFPDPEMQANSTILEDRYKDGGVLFESGAIVQLTPHDLLLRKPHYTKLLDAYSCIGVIKSSPPAGSHPINTIPPSYLVMVSGCSLVGKLPDHEVYQITGVQFVGIVQSTNDEHLSDVRKLLSSGWFYYARYPGAGRPFDLSVNIQDRYKLNGVVSQGLHNRTDVGYNFLWNVGLMGPFLQWSVNPLEWVVPMICGSYEINTVYCGGEQARVGIVSRLSSQRPGTRFNARGTNDNGDVANFVETEQFIYLQKSVVSHIQLRGTVPLFWEQPGLQVGSHKINLRRDVQQSINAFERHFIGVMSQYGSTAVINLLGSKKGEHMLSRAFQDAHKLSIFSASVPHLTFDYHSEVHTGGERSLELLSRSLDQWVSPWSYFCAHQGRAEHFQTGVLRINCVDCLDRTNSVQTLVGVQLVLPRMLDQLVMSTGNQSIVYRRFVDSMRQVWQLNGDRISRIYVGTGVLSCGRSSRLRDVRRSAARTIQQNFFDSAKHEAMCELLDNCSVHGWMKLFIDQYVPRRLQYFPPALLTTLMSRHEEFVEKHPLRIFVGTWNVNGGKRYRSLAHKHASIADWLLDLRHTVDVPNNWGFVNPNYSTPSSLNRPVDIFAVGFEEIVDLTTSNIVAGSKASKNQQSWGNFILRHLNRNRHPRDTYLLITSVQLVGVCLYLFVRARLAHHLRGISTASVKTGLGGAAGNKGAVAVCFQLASTSVCIVCSHFAAGQSAVRERNDDFNEICRRLSLQNGRSLLCHDYVFWCGDFNYRINLPAPDVKRLVALRDWPRLLEYDQLTIERRANNIFQGFHEGPVNFAPTYKYDLFCDDYDTSEKARSPAWTDRVLWRRTLLQFPTLDSDGAPVMPSQQNIDPTWSAGRLFVYNRCELRSSDHRPVGAVFDIDIHVISRNVRRRVTLDVVRKYGCVSSSVLLTVSLIECQSQKLVPDEIASETVYERFQFVENLKVIGESRKSTVVCVCRLEFNQFLLVYSNPTQARLAADDLNGLVTACSISVPSAHGACELHFTASVHSPADLSQQLESLIEVAERRDAIEHNPLPSADLFESLPFETSEAVDNTIGQDVESDSVDDDDDEDSGQEVPAHQENVSVAPPVPRRQVPPRPAPPAITSSAATGVPVIVQTNFLKNTRNQVLPASVHNSPVHKTLSDRSPPLGQLNTDVLLPTMRETPQMANSCLDLFNADALSGIDAPSAREDPPKRDQSPLFYPSDPVDLLSFAELRTESQAEKLSQQNPSTLEDSPVRSYSESSTKKTHQQHAVTNLSHMRPLRPAPPPPVPPRPDLDSASTHQI